MDDLLKRNKIICSKLVSSENELYKNKSTQLDIQNKGKEYPITKLFLQCLLQYIYTQSEQSCSKSQLQNPMLSQAIIIEKIDTLLSAAVKSRV